MNRPANLHIARHNLPFRLVDTRDGEFWVPSYIYRDDRREAWRIIINRTEETFFERIPDRHGGAGRSLDMAIERLPDILPKYTPYDCLRNKLTRYYYVYEYVRKGLKIIQVSARVCCYQRKLRMVCYYVGTENTLTRDRLDHCIARAIGTRVWASEMIRECGRSVLIREPLPNHVEDYA